MDDLAFYYISRKHKLNELKKRETSSLLYKKTIEILSIESEEFLEDSVEKPFRNINRKFIDNSSYEERLEKFYGNFEEKYKEET